MNWNLNWIIPTKRNRIGKMLRKYREREREREKNGSSVNKINSIEFDFVPFFYV
jgi:hypothetical protein